MSEVDLDAEARAFVATLKTAGRARVDPKLHLEGDVPPGFFVKSTSVLRNAEHELVQYWTKTGLDYEDPVALVDAFRAMIEARGITALPPIPAPPPYGMDDIVAIYAMGDPHIGMLSLALETGEDFDLEIAEQLMTDAVDKLARSAPPAQRAVLVCPGDLVHFDNLNNRTTTGSHQLDAASRLGKVMRVAMTTSHRMIDRMLELHDIVECKFVVGNHDGTMSMLFPLLLEARYRNNPRCIVDTTPSPILWYRFGKCFFGVCHGDKIKMCDLGEVMAADRPQDWGETLWRHWYTGHIHHEVKKEMRGCTAEALRTLAARDFWHHSQGYRSQRSMICDVWHREWGFQQRYQVQAAQLRP